MIACKSVCLLKLWDANSKKTMKSSIINIPYKPGRWCKSLISALNRLEEGEVL